MRFSPVSPKYLANSYTALRLNLFHEDHHSVEQGRGSEGAAYSPAPFSGNDLA
jgi:hypothetical protein